MSGRDVYLELGYHQNPVSKPDNAQSAPASVLPKSDPAEASKKTFTTLNSTPYTATRPLAQTPAVTVKTSDYIVGLLLIAFVLVAGLASGYFGRTWINPPIQTASDLTIMSAPITATDSSSAFIFGSADSDQILAIEPLSNGDAMMLIKTHFGANAGETETRLVRISSAVSPGTDTQLTELGPIEGTGLHLARLGDGSMITMSTLESAIIVSRFSETGITEWRQEFASSTLDRTEVAIAPDMNGFVFIAPSLDRAFSQVVSISAAGDIAWQKQFDRAQGWQPAFISLDTSGRAYAVLGAAATEQEFGDQNIAIIDANGDMLRQKLLPLDANEAIAGATAQAEGGVTYLISGSEPWLLSLDPTGQTRGTIDLPHMQYFTDAELTTTDIGTTLIASTFSRQGDRIELVLEQQTNDGMVLGQSSVTLPTGAKLDDLMQMDEATVLAVGSARTERYRPTDLFLQRVPIAPTDAQMASLASTDTSSTTVAETLDSSPIDVTIDTATIVAEAEDPISLPVVASLTVGSSDAVEAGDTMTPAAEIEPLATQPDASQQPTEPASAESETELDTIAAIDFSTELETVVDIETGVEFVVDDDAAAVSGFVDETSVTQCRFTCVDAASSEVFPMTGHFSAGSIESATDASSLHASVCESANLAPDFQTRPVCGIN
ncbi:MAG: hypothetical protein AAFU81_10015 [Pseudomonadota bacterium]